MKVVDPSISLFKIFYHLKGPIDEYSKRKTLSGKSPINLAFASNNHQLRHILKSVLDTDDYHLQSSKNASKCLEIAHQCQVVIVDLMLNDMDGLSLIEELREQFHGLYIIAVMNKESLELVNLTADNITLMVKPKWRQCRLHRSI